MIRLSDPAEGIFDYPTNDTTRRAMGENLALLFFSLFLSPRSWAVRPLAGGPASEASIIHSEDLPPLPHLLPIPPPPPSAHPGDRETVFARACCTPDKEEVKRERYAAPARRRRRRRCCRRSRRREGRNDPASLRWPMKRAPGWTRERKRQRGGGERERETAKMPLRGFKNTRPALFAGPPTHADETARSLANREKNSLAFENVYPPNPPRPPSPPALFVPPSLRCAGLPSLSSASRRSFFLPNLPGTLATCDHV